MHGSVMSKYRAEHYGDDRSSSKLYLHSEADCLSRKHIGDAQQGDFVCSVA